MREDPPTPATSPPPESLVDALRAAVTEAVARALAGEVPPERVRERVGPALDEALRDHAGALAERLLRMERLAAAGRLSAGVAHELRNPLAVMETSVFILQDRHAGDDRSMRQLRRIAEQIGLATAIVNDLLDAVRNRPVERLPVDLADVAEDALARVPRPAGVALALDLPRGVALAEGDARRLGQVAVNLLSNAVQALAEAAVEAPSLAVRAAATEREALLVVEDNGPGLSASVLPRLFDPLFSTRAEGTGLGLALSRQIAEAHGGTLTAANAEPRGARFTLALPRRVQR